MLLSALAAAGSLNKLDEKLIDAATAVSGCGPAFAYMFIEALADGGVKCGLPRDKAQKFAAEHHLLQTGGCDFHYPHQAGLAGMILPDTIEDQFMLRDYLRSHPARFFRGKKEF
jgi:hypothetical protein